MSSRGVTKMADHLAQIQAILQDSVEAGVPGIVAAISTSRGQWTLTAGVSDLERLTPIEATHLFGIGSVTKVFVATVVLQLVAEGAIQLSDAVGKTLNPKIWSGIENAEGATVRELLSHKTGIDSWEDDPAWIRKGRGSEVDPAHFWEKTEALDYLRRPKRIAQDRRHWSYSNTNYTLLGLMIEQITGGTLEAEIRRRILEPLAMMNTFFEGFERVGESVLPCRYHWATDTFRSTAGICSRFQETRGRSLIDCTVSNLSASWAAGGMVSCPSDLLKFAAALQQNDRLLTPGSMTILTDWSPTTTNARSDEMGHGLFRMIHGEEEDAWLGHFGGVLGFTSALWWAEKGDCTVCVLSNVGASHAGSVPSSSKVLVLESSILEIALQFAADQTS